jgi:hypothetical protein
MKMIFSISHITYLKSTISDNLDLFNYSLVYATEKININQIGLSNAKISFYNLNNAYSIEVISTDFIQSRISSRIVPSFYLESFKKTISSEKKEVLGRIESDLQNDKWFIYKTNNISETSALLSCFGFTCEKRYLDDVYLLAFHCFNEINYIVLWHVEKKHLEILLNEGFQYFGLISLNLQADIAFLNKKGYDVSKCSKITLNGKNYLVCYIFGKDDEVVELLSVGV